MVPGQPERIVGVHLAVVVTIGTDARRYQVPPPQELLACRRSVGKTAGRIPVFIRCPNIPERAWVRGLAEDGRGTEREDRQQEEQEQCGSAHREATAHAGELLSHRSARSQRSGGS